MEEREVQEEDAREETDGEGGPHRDDRVDLAHPDQRQDHEGEVAPMPLGLRQAAAA